MHNISMKRVYDEATKKEGYRILVDRLWPRGVKKEDLPYDLWAKEISPSSTIRKAFNHDPKKFDDFKQKYLFEINENDQIDAFLETVSEQLANQPVTLLYAAKDEEHNHVVILKDWLEENLSKSNV